METINWGNILSLVIGTVMGAGLGFLGSLYIESRKRSWEKQSRNEKIKNMLKSLKKEIEEGIKRCEALVGFAKNKKISFSRVYNTLWDSVRFEICQNVEDPELLCCLHQIYYRFDLINFNMEHDRFGVGAAFAKKYTDEIKDNFKLLKDKIKDF